MEIPWPKIPKLRAGEALEGPLDRTDGQTFEVSGTLTATSLFSYLADEEPATRGLLLFSEPPVAEKLSAAGASIYGGSMVLHAGGARVVGKLRATGLPMFPLCLYQISDLTFEDPHAGTFRMQLAVRRLSVYLRAPVPPTPEQLKLIAALRPSGENWRELRDRLRGGERYLIASDLEPAATSAVVSRLTAAGLKHWETEFCD